MISRKASSAPAKRKSAAERAKARDRVGDVIMACLGASLGLGAAMFPWYVFFNQEQFGIKAMRFSGEGMEITEPLTYQPQQIARPIDIAEAPVPDLDFLPTGTLPDRSDLAAAVSVEDQPFPEPVPFRVVYVANGRAMIEDSEGLWLVQAGSLLPDSTRVAALEKRGEQWVIVTSDKRVLPLEE